MLPKIYVVRRPDLDAWGAQSSFKLTFEETSQFIHDLQNAMIDLRHLEGQTAHDLFILVLPN
jgi:hypothetical protein